MTGKFMGWFFFGILAGIVPLGTSWVVNYVVKNNVMTYEQTIDRGQLFLLSSGLCWASLGRLLTSKRHWARVAFGGISVAVLMMSCILYALTSNRELLNEGPDTTSIMYTSTIVYLSSLLVNGFTFYVGEVTNGNDI